MEAPILINKHSPASGSLLSSLILLNQSMSGILAIGCAGSSLASVVSALRLAMLMLPCWPWPLFRCKQSFRH